MSGVWTALETAGLALGPAVVLAMLAVGGFVSSAGDPATSSDADPPGRPGPAGPSGERQPRGGGAGRLASARTSNGLS